MKNIKYLKNPGRTLPEKSKTFFATDDINDDSIFGQGEVKVNCARNGNWEVPLSWSAHVI